MEAVGGAAPGLRWRLDEVDLGPAAGITLWEPRSGTHTLRLVDSNAVERDAATFEVRGGAN